MEPPAPGIHRPARRPLAIAHRGASADAPENTIAAFELAVDQGADGISLEVHLSRDDQPVVLHDFTLERTTDGAGPVRCQTVRELKRLDAGGWRSSRFRGQRVQTLQEVFERFRGRARFWIELKGASNLYPGIEERVLSTIEVYEVVDTAIVQSFGWQSLQAMRRLSQEVSLAAMIGRPPVEGWPEPVEAICTWAELLTSEVVGRIRQAPLDCYAWTVNEPVQMDRLIEWGTSGIITDRPGLLRSRLGP